MKLEAGRRAPLLYAHRGASAELPENTMPAFLRALEVGATGIETDAHLTRDGHVVLCHDDDGERCAGVNRAIRASTLAEVRSWDMARRIRALRPWLRPDRFVMPTLDELLAELTGVPLNVDVKDHDEHAARAVVDAIRRRRAQGRVLVASFDSATLRAVRRLGYEGETSLGQAEVLGLYYLPDRVLRRLLLGAQAAQIPVRAGPLALDAPAFVAKVRRLGLRLNYWTVDDPAEATRLLALGADGIMSDDPARVAPVMPR